MFEAKPIPSRAFKVEQTATTQDDHYGYTFSPGEGMLRLAQHVTSRGDFWWTGDFVDYRGIVSIMREATYTRLDAVAGNRCHIRSWRKNYGDRTVAKLCRAFLTELHGPPADHTPKG